MKYGELTKEEYILASRAKELGETALTREYEVHLSRFLSPAEQYLYYTSLAASAPSLRERIFFWGGAIGAERRVCVILPSFAEVWGAPAAVAGTPSFFSREREAAFAEAASAYLSEEDIGIYPVRVQGSAYASLSHRDYMGSILGLGVEREVIGDIVPLDEHSAIVFCLEVSSAFLQKNMLKVGRDTVKLSDAELGHAYEIRRKFEERLIIAASPRVDAVVAGFTGASRADAKEMCLGGLVDVNYITVESPDKNLTEGDIVSVRGYGKFVFDAFVGETRSGRLRLSVRRYV